MSAISIGSDTIVIDEGSVVTPIDKSNQHPLMTGSSFFFLFSSFVGALPAQLTGLALEAKHCKAQLKEIAHKDVTLMASELFIYL